MKPHKNDKLIKSRGLILRISFIIAIALVFLAFQWNVPIKQKKMVEKPVTEVFRIDAISTIQNDDKKVVPPTVDEVKPDIIEEIVIVETQVEPRDLKVIDPTIDIVVDKGIKNDADEQILINTPHIVAEVMPQFEGGMKAFYKYFSKNYKHKQCFIPGGEAKVNVKFVIETDGDASRIEILNEGVCPEINAEIIRVLENMPAWKPGRQSGVNVPVYFVLPVKIIVPNH